MPDDLALAPLSDAVQLFLARAGTRAPSFRPGDADLGTIVQVCRRLEAAAVVIGAAGRGDAGVCLELLAAADELRRQSGQGHRPWEIRARLGNLEDRLAIPDAASAPAPAGRDHSLPAAASPAVRALRSLMTSTAS